MSLVIDGERSKNYIAHGRKQLAIIKELDLPAKTTIRNGFLVKAQQQDGLEKILIKAPMGAAVLCSTAAGLDLMTADYWLSDLTPKRAAHIGDLPAIYPNIVWQALHPVTGEETPNKKFIPATVTAYGYQNAPARPAVLPTGGEAFWIGLRAANADGQMFETCRNFYADAGRAAKRFGDMRLYVDGLVDFRNSYQFLPTAKYFRFAEQYLLSSFQAAYSAYPTGETGKAVYALVVEWDEGGPTTRELLVQDLLTGMTAFVRDKILGVSGGNQGWYSRSLAIGGYACGLDNDSEITLHGVIVPLPINYDSDYKDYFDTNPGERRWWLFFSLRKGGTTYLHSFNQFSALLEQLVPGAGSDYSLAQNVFRQLFPCPNYQASAPYDSVMFHSHGGDIYTWTRKYGAVKFSPTGLEAVNLTLPAVISTEGVRPIITLIEGGDYLCVCEKIAESEQGQNQVLGVYRGSPFSGWATVTEDSALVYVQAARTNETDTQLFGILQAEGDYHFGFFHESWRQLGSLPAPTSRANWAVGFFGDGAPVFASALPVTQMQAPALPYADYAGITP